MEGLVELRRHPITTLRGVSLGWIVLMAVVWRGDLIADTASSVLFGWNRGLAYRLNNWTAFYVSAAVLSAGAFLLSGYVVARWHRACRIPAVAGFAVTVTAAIAGTALAVYLRAPQATPIPHPWFYVMWLGLPFVGCIGLILAPAMIVIGARLSSIGNRE